MESEYLPNQVKVCDEELRNLAKAAECWDEINNVLEQYLSIMDDLLEKGVKSGKIHDALLKLREHAQTYSGLAAGLGGKVSGKANGFVSDVEGLDRKMYQK